MTLTGMKKHIGVLEQAGLVTTERVGRVRTCKLGLHELYSSKEALDAAGTGPTCRSARARPFPW